MQNHRIKGICLTLDTFEFPKDFIFGVATSAHQVEGYNIYNDWWDWEQKPGHIKNEDKSGGGCDFWNRYNEDIEMMALLGIKAHRFSIEWSRVEPREGEFNYSALEHYSNMVDVHIKHDVKPMITLHHFTSPLWFAAKGGFLKSENIRYFERFVYEVARKLAGRVHLYCTINEPNVYTFQGFLEGKWPPGLKSMKAYFKVLRNLLLAHKVAAETVKETDPKAKLGFANNFIPFEPLNIFNPLDHAAARFVDYCFNGLILKALATSRLYPPISRWEKVDGLKESSDFIGLNYYTRGICNWRNPLKPALARKGERLTQMGYSPYPQGLLTALKKMSKLNLPIYVTENGLATLDERWRSEVIASHLLKIAEAIKEGIDVRGYFYWSYIDNFEWDEGWEPKFGLVAFDPLTFERKLKESAYFYSKICKERRITGQIGQIY